jgi:hypothetical protein
MRLSAIDRISPATPPDQLPIRLDLVGSRGSVAISLILLVSAAAFLLTPFILIGTLAAFQTDAFLKADISWSSGLQLGAAFLLALGLIAFAVRRVKMTWASAATVEIGHGVVAVVQRGLGATRRWSLPISEYLGIAHNVRTSLSGARHELVLVHRNPAFNVLIGLAPSMPQQHVDRMAILLGLLEIPAHSISEKRTPAAAPPVAAEFEATPVPELSPLVGVVERPKLRLAA